MAWTISGARGRLLTGTKTAAAFTSWSATPAGEGRWRIATGGCEEDPYWFENGSSFRAALVVGQGEVRGPAELVSRDPLVFEMEIA